MPILQAFIFGGFSEQQKNGLREAYAHAIVSDLSSALKQVRVLISEVNVDDTSTAGEVGRPLSLVHVYLLEGRTEEQKAKLIATLSADTARILQVEQASVRILLHDMPTSNFGAGGVTAKALGR